MVSWLLDWLVACLFVCLFGWLLGWLIALLVGRLVAWLGLGLGLGLTQPTLDPTCTNTTPQKSALLQRSARHQQYLPHQNHLTDNQFHLPTSNAPSYTHKNPHKACKYKANETPPTTQLTNGLMTFQERSLFDQRHFLQLWSSGAPGKLQSGASTVCKTVGGNSYTHQNGRGRSRWHS